RALNQGNGNMKAQRSTVWISIFAGALIASAGVSLAQQKTAKECDAEWQANKAAIQASGKTKKDYVAACRQGSGHAAAQPAPKASPRDARTAAQTPATPKQPSTAPESRTQPT